MTTQHLVLVLQHLEKQGAKLLALDVRNDTLLIRQANGMEWMHKLSMFIRRLQKLNQTKGN